MIARMIIAQCSIAHAVFQEVNIFVMCSRLFPSRALQQCVSLSWWALKHNRSFDFFLQMSRLQQSVHADQTMLVSTYLLHSNNYITHLLPKEGFYTALHPSWCSRCPSQRCSSPSSWFQGWIKISQPQVNKKKHFLLFNNKWSIGGVLRSTAYLAKNGNIALPSSWFT